MILGLALNLFSPIVPLCAVLTWIRLHLVVVRVEEPMLDGSSGKSTKHTEDGQAGGYPCSEGSE